MYPVVSSRYLKYTNEQNRKKILPPYSLHSSGMSSAPVGSTHQAFKQTKTG